MLAREEVALGELIQPLAEAKEAGADAMVTPCPLCHLSLDAWQGKASKEADIEFDMPIFHLAQLVGAAAGLTLRRAAVQAAHHQDPPGHRQDLRRSVDP